MTIAIEAHDASSWRSGIGSQRFKVKWEEGRLLSMLPLLLGGPAVLRIKTRS
jgi:hypothetical protein